DPRHTPVTRGPTHDTVVVDPGGQQVEVETGPEEGVSDPRGPDVCFGEEVCTGESEGRCGPGPQERQVDDPGHPGLDRSVHCAQLDVEAVLGLGSRDEEERVHPSTGP